MKKALKKINEVIKQKTNKFREETIKYKEGNLIWVNSLNISSSHLAKKLAFKRVESFLVIKKMESSTYELLIPKM